MWPFSLKLIIIVGMGFVIGMMLVNVVPEFAILTQDKEQVLLDLDVKKQGQTSVQRNLIPIGWRDLLPVQEQLIFEQTQEAQKEAITSSELDPMAGQVLAALVAVNDQQYQASMYSTAITETYLGKMISIPGFIVPIDVLDGQRVKSFFLVPYFGACLHYPPPSPNQMIYVRLTEPVSLPPIYDPYLVEGLLSAELYEDPLGSSAYVLETTRILAYSGEPDDFRTH